MARHHLSPDIHRDAAVLREINATALAFFAHLPPDIVVKLDALSREHANFLEAVRFLRGWAKENGFDDAPAVSPTAADGRAAGLASGGRALVATQVVRLCITDETYAVVQANFADQQELERRAALLGMHANYVWNAPREELRARVARRAAERFLRHEIRHGHDVTQIRAALGLDGPEIDAFVTAENCHLCAACVATRPEVAIATIDPKGPAGWRVVGLEKGTPLRGMRCDACGMPTTDKQRCDRMRLVAFCNHVSGTTTPNGPTIALGSGADTILGWLRWHDAPAALPPECSVDYAWTCLWAAHWNDAAQFIGGVLLLTTETARREESTPSGGGMGGSGALLLVPVARGGQGGAASDQEPGRIRVQNDGLIRSQRMPSAEPSALPAPQTEPAPFSWEETHEDLIAELHRSRERQSAAKRAYEAADRELISANHAVERLENDLREHLAQRSTTPSKE